MLLRRPIFLQLGILVFIADRIAGHEYPAISGCVSKEAHTLEGLECEGILVLRKSYYAYACQGIYRYVGYEYNYAEEMQNELIMRLETTIDECMKTSSSTENLRSALSETVNDFRKNIEEDDRKYLYLVIIVIPKSWTNFITHYWTNYFTPCVVVTTGGTFAFRHHGDVSQPLEALTYFRKNKKKKNRKRCVDGSGLLSMPQQSTFSRRPIGYEPTCAYIFEPKKYDTVFLTTAEVLTVLTAEELVAYKTARDIAIVSHRRGIKSTIVVIEWSYLASVVAPFTAGTLLVEVNNRKEEGKRGILSCDVGLVKFDYGFE